MCIVCHCVLEVHNCFFFVLFCFYRGDSQGIALSFRRTFLKCWDWKTIGPLETGLSTFFIKPCPPAYGGQGVEHGGLNENGPQTPVFGYLLATGGRTIKKEFVRGGCVANTGGLRGFKRSMSLPVFSVASTCGLLCELSAQGLFSAIVDSDLRSISPAEPFLW